MRSSEELTLGDISMVVDDPLRDASVTVPRQIAWDSRSGFLEWSPPAEGADRPSARGVLQRFIALHGLEDVAYWVFAQKYGVLGLTRGGLIEGATLTQMRQARQTMVWDATRDVFRERIALWRPYVATLKYLVACFTRLRVDPTTSPRLILEDEGIPSRLADMWESFGMNPDFSDEQFLWFLMEGPQTICDNLERVGPDHVLQHLAWNVSRVWIPTASIHPILVSDGKTVRSAIRLGGSWAGNSSIMEENCLFHILIGQLMAIATKPAPDTVVACTQCGRYYEPLRRPSKGQQHYCETCRADVARQKKREWAAKQRAAKQTTV